VVRLHLGDRTLELPPATEDAVRLIAERDTFVPKDLDAVADEASRLVLCRRLVREGLLTFARRTADA
jgi:bifunctional lysine-specific demethylase and histidyl-hydroxylase NO66